MIQKYSQPNNYPRTTSEAHLPYCLTREYQMRVHAIAKNDTNDNRGENKTTGIWCKYERND